MDIIIKQILILIFSFSIYYWIQSIDDKKYNIKRYTLYEKFKNPILITSIIGLILNINLNDLEIFKPTKNISVDKYSKIKEFTLYPPPF